MDEQLPFPQGSLHRRGLLVATIVAPLVRQRGPPIVDAASEWQVYKARFLSPDGRVIDTGNRGVSHSAGQGTGLLFAASFNDPDVFERILDWTNQTLRKRSDNLFAWRYIPGAGSVPASVPDLNDATDGDICIACALARAAIRWRRADYQRQASAIARDILVHLLCQQGRRMLLLPGAEGFETRQSVIINPSYYLFFALREIAGLAPSPLWQQVYWDGVDLLSNCRFGRWQLPPDWLAVSRDDGSLQPAPDRPARFSYDAVRIPLYLAWSHLSPPGVMDAITSFWNSQAGAAAWIDLRSGVTADYGPSAGMQAIRQLAVAASTGRATLGAIPRVAAARDYYSACLILLTHLAWLEREATTVSETMDN